MIATWPEYMAGDPSQLGANLFKKLAKRIKSTRISKSGGGIQVDTTEGGLSLSPEGIALRKAKGLQTPPPADGGGVMDYVKANPLIVAGGAVALGLVIFMVVKKRKRKR